MLPQTVAVGEADDRRLWGESFGWAPKAGVAQKTTRQPVLITMSLVAVHRRRDVVFTACSIVSIEDANEWLRKTSRSQSVCCVKMFNYARLYWRI